MSEKKIKGQFFIYKLTEISFQKLWTELLLRTKHVEPLIATSGATPARSEQNSDAWIRHWPSLHVHRVSASAGNFQRDNTSRHRAQIISDWFPEHDGAHTASKLTRVSTGCGGTGDSPQLCTVNNGGNNTGNNAKTWKQHWNPKTTLKTTKKKTTLKTLKTTLKPENTKNTENNAESPNKLQWNPKTTLKVLKKSLRQAASCWWHHYHAPRTHQTCRTTSTIWFRPFVN